MRQNDRRQRPDDLITAPEIACFAYCLEVGRLQDGLELEPENRKAVAERFAWCEPGTTAPLEGSCPFSGYFFVGGFLTAFWLIRLASGFSSPCDSGAASPSSASICSIVGNNDRRLRGKARVSS